MATRRAGPAGRQADSASAPPGSGDRAPSPYLNMGQTARSTPSQQQQQLSTLALVLFTAWLVPILLGAFLFEGEALMAPLWRPGTTADISILLSWLSSTQES